MSKESRGMRSDSIGKKAVSVAAVLRMQWGMEVAKLAAAKAAGASASRERMPQPPSRLGVAGGVR